MKNESFEGILIGSMTFDGFISPPFFIARNIESDFVLQHLATRYVNFNQNCN